MCGTRAAAAAAAVAATAAARRGDDRLFTQLLAVHSCTFFFSGARDTDSASVAVGVERRQCREERCHR